VKGLSLLHEIRLRLNYCILFVLLYGSYTELKMLF